MTHSDMRKFMEAVDPTKKSLDEAPGGIIDKGLAAIGIDSAKTRVKSKKDSDIGKEEVGKELDSIRSEWDKYRGSQGIEDSDVEGFKEFLDYWNFNNSEIDRIISEPFDMEKSLEVAAKIQHKSRKGVTGQARGGPDTNKKPAGDDFESIMKHFSSVYGGNGMMLQAEFNDIKKADQLSDPWAKMGWAYLKAGNKGKK